MRISIWQQFSSNHSADFTIVGKFPTAEEASKAGDRLREILVKMARWYDDPDNMPIIERIYWSFQDADQREFAPPEVTLNNQFQTGFSEAPIDWVTDADIITKAVMTFNDLIIVDNTLPGIDHRTWTGAQPFEKLLERLGAQVSTFEPIIAGSFWIRLHCKAVNEISAQAIEEDYERVRKSWRDEEFQRGDIPWMFNDDSKLLRQGEQLEFRIFEINSFANDFPDLIHYLQNKGCTEITYEFPTEPFNRSANCSA